MDGSFPELSSLKELIEVIQPYGDVETIAEALHLEQVYPIYGLRLGSTDPNAPTFGLVGGVHGLEKIGTNVVLAYLHTIAELLQWDSMIHALLKHVRFIFIPLINPVGMHLGTRANGNGVDLMRNAPVESNEVKKWFLMGGHRISNRLPWYRGDKGAPMQPEAQGVCNFVRKHTFQSKAAIIVDCHSGFGLIDRVWFPYAHSRTPFPLFAEMMALKELLDRTYPSHFYRFEPQSTQYMTHGDLWDYLFEEHRLSRSTSLFLPLSLEMGSWNWIKKNPGQIFSSLGIFNPIKPHRHQRVLRRHLLFFDFLARALISPDSWTQLEGASKSAFEKRALDTWYGGRA